MNTILTKPIEESQYYQLVDSLYSIPLIFGVSGHRHRPDFLYISNETGVPQLYRWDATTRSSHLVASSNEPIAGPVALHASRPWAVFARDTGGNEDYDIYVIDFAGNMQRISAQPLGRVTHLFWASDDAWVVVGNDPQHVYARMLSRDGSLRDLITTDKQILTATYDEQRGLLVVSVGRGAGTRLAMIDVAAAKVVRWIDEAPDSEDILPSAYAPRGYLAYVTDVSSAHQELAIRSIETLAEVARVAVPGEIDWIVGDIVWMDEHRLLGVITKDGQIAPRILDLRSATWSAPLTDGSVWGASVTKDGPIWVSTSFSQPPHIQGMTNGETVTLIPSRQSGEHIEVESHWYPSFDGRKVQGWLVKNPDPRAPLIVYCHGGPTFMTGNWWDPWMLALVRAGYTVFAPNFRGSISFGSEWRNLNVGDLGGGDLQDVLYGARYATQLLGLTTKPAIVGGSYGGYLVLQALTTQPQEWAGGVALVPVADWAEDYELADSHFRFYLQHFFRGTPAEKPDLYRDRSPITHIQHLSMPVLILHGENDPRCPIQGVRRFAEEAQRHNSLVQLIVTQDEGHGAAKNVNAIRDTVLMLEHVRQLFE